MSQHRVSLSATQQKLYEKAFLTENKAGKCTTFYVSLLVCQPDNCYAIT